MAGYVELFIDQGATFNSVINLSDDVTNANINIAGYTVKSQMKRSYYSAGPSANLTCTITDANNGEVLLSLTAAQTGVIKSGRYLFDVITTDPNSKVDRVMEGIITVLPRVTT